VCSPGAQARTLAPGTCQLIAWVEKDAPVNQSATYQIRPIQIHPKRSSILSLFWKQLERRRCAYCERYFSRVARPDYSVFSGLTTETLILLNGRSVGRVGVCKYLIWD